MYNYISKQGQQGILNFKYKGGSQAFSYKYLWSPIAQAILKITPLRMAPNLMTLLGTLLQIGASINIMIQTPLSQKLQPISLLIWGICLFVYQMVDNADGKQSRRNGTSSPLGMLFDHGCDAFGVVFMAFVFGRMVWVEDQKTFILGIFFGIIFGFYFSVWAQYHSGGYMILGRVNAVDDGIPFTWLMAFFTYFVGQQFWNTTQVPYFNDSLTKFFPYLVMGILPIQMFSLVKNAKHNFTGDLAYAFSHFLHVALIIGSLFSVLQLTDWYLQSKYFYQIFFSLCLCFVRDISYYQVCVVADMKYNQWTFSTCVYIIGYPSYIFLQKYFEVTICDESLWVNGIFAIIVLEYINFVVSVVRQIAKVLKINVFTLTKEQHQKLDQKLKKEQQAKRK